MEHRSISIAFVRAMFERSDLDEATQAQLLDQAGIQSVALSSDRARVSPAQFSQLHQSIVASCEDESMGHFSQPLKIGSFNAMTRYVQGADDLRQAIDRNVEFYNLFHSGFRLSLQSHGEHCSYRLENEDNVNLSCWVYEQHLMINHRFFCWLTGTPLPLTRVNLNYAPPAHRGEYHYLFFCDTRFDQAYSELIMPSRLLELPVVRSRQELEQKLSRVPYDFLQMPARESSYTEQIRRYLKKSLPHVPSYQQLSESLGLTPQTLRRRLRQEGCDYRLIRNELIRDLAIEALLQGDSEVKTIAYQLGFSEPSAFIRAFKQWTGLTPNQYREQQPTAEH